MHFKYTYLVSLATDLLYIIAVGVRSLKICVGFLQDNFQNQGVKMICNKFLYSFFSYTNERALYVVRPMAHAATNQILFKHDSKPSLPNTVRLRLLVHTSAHVTYIVCLDVMAQTSFILVCYKTLYHKQTSSAHDQKNAFIMA